MRVPARCSFRIASLSPSPSLSENDAPPPSQPQWHSSKAADSGPSHSLRLTSTGSESTSSDLVDSLVMGGYHPAPMDYMHELHTTRERIKRLEFELVKVSSERDTLRDVLNQKGNSPIDPHLVSPMTAKTPTSSGPRPTRESTKGKIRFWTTKDFDDWLDSPEAQRASFDRGQIPYVEEEDGSIASAEKIKAIRLCMRSAWQELACNHRAPQVYGQLDASSRKFYHTFVEEAHPLFKCAQDGWKLDKLSRTTYPAWKSLYLDDQGNLIPKGERKRKRDKTKDEDDEDPSLLLKKRQVSERDKMVTATREEGSSTNSSKSPSTSVQLEALLASTKPVKVVSAPRQSVNEAPTPETAESIGQDDHLESVNPLNDLAHIASTLDIEIPQLARGSNPSATTSHEAVANVTPAISPTALPLASSGPKTAMSPSTSHEAIADTPAIPSTAPLASSNHGGSETTMSTSTSSNTENADTVAPQPTGGTSVAVKAKKPAKMRPGPGKNGRNLCAHRWLKAFKDTADGTLGEFNRYYQSLSDEQRVAYEKEATELVTNNGWNKNTFIGKIY